MTGVSRTAQIRARTRKLLFIRQRGRCCWCGLTMRTSGDPNHAFFATIEHLVPRAHGGVNARVNLALACRRCNLDRGAPEPVMVSKAEEVAGALHDAFMRAGLVSP